MIQEIDGVNERLMHIKSLRQDIEILRSQLQQCEKELIDFLLVKDNASLPDITVLQISPEICGTPLKHDKVCNNPKKSCQYRRVGSHI